MQNSEEFVLAYEVDVQFPDVSGMEHLDMLLTRSRLVTLESDLTDDQRQRVAKADQLLFKQATQFYKSIDQIANLPSWRKEENVPANHWWWYLDVIVELPTMPVHPNGASQVQEARIVEAA